MNRDEALMGDGGCGGNAAPYVLGALTESEHEAFIAHLASCAICREEVAALEAVTAALPAAAPRVPAPRRLKRRVLAEVREDQRRQRSGAAAMTRHRSPVGSRRAGLPAVGAIAAGVAAIAAAVIVLVGGSGGSGATRVVRAQVGTPGASAEVRLSAGHAQLTIAGMPQPRQGRVYQVWVERVAGTPAPTDALFSVTSSGSATVAVPGSIAGVREVLVTSEPVGGSLRPTSPPVVTARLD